MEYSIVLEFNSIIANSPLDAAQIISKMILEDANQMIYIVQNEESKEITSVDLSEDDADAVSPYNDYQCTIQQDK
jgi:phage tail sheath protein FI